MKTEYVVWVQGSEMYRGPDLETAVRTWDRTTYQGGVTSGGIAVHTWDQVGVMLRDGWILHLQENGAVYLNPRLIEKEAFVGI